MIHEELSGARNRKISWINFASVNAYCSAQDRHTVEAETGMFRTAWF
jgi:hypothetical protein